MNMQKEIIHTDLAPKAIGPYVQAVRVGDLIYTAGQGGVDPSTGKMVEGGVESQARRTMHNLASVLEAAGSSFEQVVKTTIFLRYIRDFDTVNEVYASFFEGSPPARSTVAVSALPMAALVEIEMVALVIEPVSKLTEEIVEQSEEQKTKAQTVEKTKGKKSKKKKMRRKGKKKKGKK
jgi:2-iminobutanoate/2-iminopropanoate deaminase